jgi:hypothetical protein
VRSGGHADGIADLQPVIPAVAGMTGTSNDAGYIRSMIAAMPWPPPMHIVTRP